MRWWKVGLGIALALSLTVGCGNVQRVAKEEMNKYSMQSYRQGNERQLTTGKTLNTALLQALKAECAKRGIKLTHETYAEGLDGNFSYSYFINGDARHFIIVHVFPSEQDRIREISEIYGTGDGKKAVSAQSVSSQAAVISVKDNAALVYSSSAQKDSPYREEIQTIFDKLLAQMNNRSK
ncbi:hypothetical protein [Paenibacillus barengoltzii]|uniref:Uncharacterized protein n=1 Tax=Paenibacillus barengoltzii G22 TaxID=1235795 RepID=R9LDW9_9BACL|nr:hypothetical protein [Paenibacillus barengoltzii]EOS56910.1 hypothetical protein C812_01839 [Paenibacillus barengoltzii G22]